MKIVEIITGFQEKSNKNRNPKLGKGFSSAYRLNPYNPMSYITITLLSVVAIFNIGFVGVYLEFKKHNPFKWY